jgi:hypothetical protein
VILFGFFPSLIMDPIQAAFAQANLAEMTQR